MIVQATLEEMREFARRHDIRLSTEELIRRAAAGGDESRRFTDRDEYIASLFPELNPE